ncbi:MAG: M16 family metallopeptidase [Parvibaculales bacterium]
MSVRLLMVFCVFVLLIMPARAIDLAVQELTTKSGVRFWFVEDKTLPIINVRMSWRGGAGTETADTNGLTRFMVSLLDEGAGSHKAGAFKAALVENGIRLGFSADLENITGTVQCLTSNQDKAFALLKLALQQPRFDDEAIERMRTTLINGRKSALGNPRVLNSENWWRLAFGEHPYARPVAGSIENLKTFNKADIIAAHHAHLARDNLILTIVGHISAQAAKEAVEDVFSGLPAKSTSPPVADVSMMADGTTARLDYPTPQAEILFGLQGIPYQDPDYFAAYVMNYILAGGGFSSRLMEEIREKRGLAYGVYASLGNYQHASIWRGNIATAPDNIETALSLLKREIKRIKDTPVSAEELDSAKSYLTGAFYMRFDSSRKIAGQLHGLQLIGFQKDYIKTRNDRIQSVTVDQVQAVARRLLHEDRLKISIIANTLEAETD